MRDTRDEPTMLIILDIVEFDPVEEASIFKGPSCK